MSALEWIGLTALIAFVAGGIAWFVSQRAAREKRDAEALRDSVENQRNLPQTLHPVIDTDLCIGSLSCLTVCPEGDILGVVDGRAELINASACIGHGKCALECPVGAISLVFGTSQRGVDLPEVNDAFETSRAGVYIVGELGGMGLIKNAVTQGLQVANHLAEHPTLAGHAPRGLVDVAVVGSGPAGIATALGLKARHKSYRLLEQDTVGGTIAHYPRQKVVMTERVELPFLGKFGATLISKEELLGSLEKAIHKGGLKVEQGVKVQAVKGDDGAFVVETSKGPVHARKVVLAVGRRGSPRKMGVPGEELPKVAYRLIDPVQYEGCRVLVVGGGDSALECAIQLAEETDAEVTLSYRQPDLSKCRAENKRRFHELVEKGTLFKLMPSEVKKVSPKAVTLSVEGRTLELPNDYVLVNIGGELPTEFLKQAGVGMRKHFGTGRAGEEPAAQRGSAREVAERRKTLRLSLGLFALGALIVTLLAAVGWDYYWLAKPERLEHLRHKVLRPSGVWGHGIGIVATLVMMSNFLYALRKRWRALKGAGTIRRWMTFHQFVGFMSPLTIAFHAAFQSNNMLASITTLFLLIVVVTGIIGRFFYGLIPTADGRTEEFSAVAARWERLKKRVDPLLDGTTSPDVVRSFMVRATRPIEAGPLFSLLWQVPTQYLNNRRLLGTVRPFFKDREHFHDFQNAFFRLDRMRTQVTFYKSLKRFMSIWRVLHVVLAVALVFVITAHIAVSLFVGYRWIFT